jgi:hypothetical protein
MLEARTADTYVHADEVFLIAHDDSLHPGVIEKNELSALAPDLDIPHIDSVKHASNVLETLLSGPPHTLSCSYKLDDLQFAEMRSSVLRAGLAVLAVLAGHYAIIAPISRQLPIAHWRSEFIFRATRGIRLLKPELSEQALLLIVTRQIHFYTQHDGHAPADWHQMA